MPAPVEIHNPHLRYLTQFRDPDRNPFPGLPPFPSLPEKKDGVGAVLMTYLISTAFGVHRYPGAADRMVSPAQRAAVIEVGAWIRQEPKAESILQDCVHELQRLQQEISAWYARAGLETLILYRRIGWESKGRGIPRYDLSVAREWQSALRNGRPMEVELDTLTHWTAAPEAYNHGERNLRLEYDVPRENIVLCSELMEHMEPNEYLVVNRSPSGRLALDPRRVQARGWPAGRAEHTPEPAMGVQLTDIQSVTTREFLQARVQRALARMNGGQKR